MSNEENRDRTVYTCQDPEEVSERLVEDVAAFHASLLPANVNKLHYGSLNVGAAALDIRGALETLRTNKQRDILDWQFSTGVFESLDSPGTVTWVGDEPGEKKIRFFIGKLCATVVYVGTRFFVSFMFHSWTEANLRDLGWMFSDKLEFSAHSSARYQRINGCYGVSNELVLLLPEIMKEAGVRPPPKESLACFTPRTFEGCSVAMGPQAWFVRVSPAGKERPTQVFLCPPEDSGAPVLTLTGDGQWGKEVNTALDHNNIPTLLSAFGIKRITKKNPRYQAWDSPDVLARMGQHVLAELGSAKRSGG